MEFLLRTVNKFLGPGAAAVVLVIGLIIFIASFVLGIINYIKKRKD